MIEVTSGSNENDCQVYRHCLRIDLAVQFALLPVLIFMAIYSEMGHGINLENYVGIFKFVFAIYLFLIGIWNFIGNSLRLLLCDTRSQKMLFWRRSFEVAAIVYLLFCALATYFRLLPDLEKLIWFASIFALIYLIKSFVEWKKITQH